MAHTETDMSTEQVLDALNDLNGRLERRFEAIDRQFETIDRRFERIDERFEHIDRHMVTKSDVFSIVMSSQAVFYAGAIGIVIVLNAVGAFS